MSTPAPAPAPATAPTTTSVTHGGVTFQVSSQAATFQPKCIHDGADRRQLSASERSKLFSEFISQEQPNFGFFSLDSMHPDKIQEAFDWQSTIAALVDNLRRFDVLDVFKLICRFQSGSFVLDSTKPFIDVIQDHHQVTEAEVALSNEYFHTLVDTTDNNYRENLLWSEQFILSNLDPDFAIKVKARYHQFPDKQRGGTLLFLIIAKMSLHDTRAGAEFLLKTILEKKISEYPGENVLDFITMLKAVHKRLSTITLTFTTTTSTGTTTTATQQSVLPADFSLQVLDLLQTTSVPEFNELFRNMKVQHQSKYLAKGYQSLPDLDQLLTIAEKYYLQLSTESKWNHSKAASSSSFTTEVKSGTPPTRTCWNCGSSDHTLPQCPHKHDSQRIKANKTQFYKNRKENKSSQTSGSQTDKKTPSKTRRRVTTGLYAPPSRSENGRRIIKNKLHIWNKTTEHWDEQQPSPKSDASDSSNKSSSTSPPLTPHQELTMRTLYNSMSSYFETASS